MIWRLIEQLESQHQAALFAWRCPADGCKARAKLVGIPEVWVVAPGVVGGEFYTIECAAGHRSHPQQTGREG